MAEEAHVGYRATFSSESNPFPLADLNGEPSATVGGCINVITGDYVDFQQDLVVPGVIPLPVERSYCSSDKSKGNLAFSWHLNLGGVIGWLNENETKLGWKGAFGRELHFRKRIKLVGKEILFGKKKQEPYGLNKAMLRQGIANNSTGIISGKTQIRNYHVHEDKPKKYNFTITNGEGTRYIFKYDKKAGSYYDLTTEIRPNNLQIQYKYFPGTGFIHRVHVARPDNSRMQSLDFEYIGYKKNKRDSQITISAHDGRKVTYILEHFKKAKIGNFRPMPFYVKEVIRPESPNERYQYKTINGHERVVWKEHSPNGNFTNVAYYTTGQYGPVEIDYTHPWFLRVREIQRPLGPDATPHTAFRFEYHLPTNEEDIVVGGTCGVYNAHGCKTDYCWDDLKRLRQINRYNAHGHLYLQDNLFWGKDVHSGDLQSRVFNCNGTPLFCRNYTYDGFGNVILDKLYGQLSGQNEIPLLIDGEGNPIENLTERYQKSYTYSQDNKNLLLCEVEGSRKKTYVYYPHNNQLASVFTYSHDHLVLREFHTYDEDGNLQSTTTDNGCTTNPDDLTGVTFKKIRRIQSTKNMPWGLPEVVEDFGVDLTTQQEILEKKILNCYNPAGKLVQQNRYDCHGDYVYSLYWEYDHKYRLIKEVNALGESICKSYDDHGNVIWESGPDPRVYKEYVYDYSNRLICKREIHPDVTLATHYRYNLLSQKIEEIDPYGNSTLFEYDDFGRMVRKISPTINHFSGQPSRPTLFQEYDGLGNPCAVRNENNDVTRTQYTIRGKPFHIDFPDGTFERYSYYIHGPLMFKRERNGCATIYERDSLDRVIETRFYAPDATLLWKTSCLYDAFHLLQETDAMGHVTEYAYDPCGRKISTKKGDYFETYAYDSLGRLAKQCSYYNSSEAVVKSWRYDFLDRKIEEKTEDLNGHVSELITYHYDHSGQCTHTITYGKNGQPQIDEQIYNTHGVVAKHIDPVGKIKLTRMIFDHRNSLGQFVSAREIIDALGNVALVVNDAFGNKSSVELRDPMGELIQAQEYFYDNCGKVCKTVEKVITAHQPHREVVTMSIYNSMNQIVANYEAFGSKDQKVTHYHYNHDGQLICIENPSGKKIDHTYHPDGLLATYVSDDFAYYYEYDLSQRLISSFDKLSQTGFSRVYDEQDRLVEEKQGHHCLRYQRDGLDRVTALILPDGSSVHYQYAGELLKSVFKTTALGKELYRHTYDQYDYCGHVIQETLINQAGERQREFDDKQRLIFAKTAFHEESVPENGYDAHDNLLLVEGHDPQGSFRWSYGYDALSQLTAEDSHATHTYQYDSIYNRTFKDSHEYVLNDLNQVLHDGLFSYQYDDDGNLIRKQSAKDVYEYAYDSLGRLVKSTHNARVTSYVYDSLNRRLSKTTRGRTVYFLHDLENEIGAIENGVLVQFRALGVGEGAELGAAIAFELNGEVFAPIHGFAGQVLGLVNRLGKVVESYRYSAFGEEFIFNAKGQKLKASSVNNPWRFCSKRIDQETGFIYFGNRYYDASLGRWITPDPIGHEDGPNLYAYVSNSPLTHFDLYGLFEGSITFWDGFESQFTNYDQSRIGFTYRVPDKLDLSIGFVNGVLNTYDMAAETRGYLADLVNYNIQGVHNATHGIYSDLYECFMGLRGVATEPVRLIHQQWDDFFKNNSADAMYLQICHSQGAIHVRNALMSYPEELRKRILVVAIAPGAYIQKEYCADVMHYRAAAYRDFIPRLDRSGMRKCKDTIVTLESHKDAGFFDHGIMSPTYQKVLKAHMDNYVQSGGKSI